MEPDLLRVLDAGANAVPETVGEIRRFAFVQSGAGVHEGAIDSLLHHLVNLPGEFLRLQSVVPGPERHQAAFARRVAEVFLEWVGGSEHRPRSRQDGEPDGSTHCATLGSIGHG
ncbi:MAG: hypothetical protein HY298_05330 [Verrucomicrobia bacterium]|nr:hypothetical protein [Verrucomicrobiota bacterium]